MYKGSDGQGGFETLFDIKITGRLIKHVSSEQTQNMKNISMLNLQVCSITWTFKEELLDARAGIWDFLKIFCNYTCIA